MPEEKPGARDECSFSSLFTTRQLPSWPRLFKMKYKDTALNGSSDLQLDAWKAQPSSIKRTLSA